ncbi:MAG: AzlC family ABC transporter permease [Chloroflexota bacterium]
MSVAREEFLLGAKHLTSVLPAAIPFGMLMGVVAVDIGFWPSTAVLNSLLVYAGTAQLAAMQLVDNGAALPIIILTVLVINLRMMMYSASLSHRFRELSLKWKLFVSFVLTDQAFAFTWARYESEPDLPLERMKWYYAGSAAPLGVIWVISTTVGAWFGTRIPESWELDFAIPLMLIAMVVPNIKSLASLTAAVVSGVLSIVAAGMPLNLGLVVAAVVGMLAGFAEEKFFHPQSREEESVESV